MGPKTKIVWVLFKWFVFVAILVALGTLIMYVLNYFGVWDPKQEDYDALLDKYNVLATTYNRAVRRSYMVYLGIGSESEGLPVSVKLVTGGYELITDVTPKFQLQFSDPNPIKNQTDYKTNSDKGADLYCFENKDGRCVRTRYNKGGPDLFKQDSSSKAFCIPTSCESPVCTVRVPYFDSSKKEDFSAKRALAVGAMFSDTGAMQINQLKLFFVKDGKEVLSISNDETKGEYTEIWNLDGKMWNERVYDVGSSQSVLPSNGTADMTNGGKSAWLSPDEIQANTYYRLFVNATGGFGLVKTTSAEFNAAIADKPIQPILGTPPEANAIPEWKKPLPF